MQHNVRIGASDHLVSEALYLSDPDGNGIEIYTDRDPAVWSWENGKVAMSTDPLDGESIIAESAGQTWDGLPVERLWGMFIYMLRICLKRKNSTMRLDLKLS